MYPDKILLFDSEHILIKWNNQTEQKIRLIDLRKNCPCAICKAEREHHKDWSHVFFTSDELKIVDMKIIGSYALNIVWADGHNTGIYEFKKLTNIENGVVI